MVAEVDRNDEIDRDIDQLLAGLRSATASPGMEGRILRAAADRAAETQAPKWWLIQRRRPLRAASILTVGLACAVAFGVFVLRRPQLGHSSTNPQRFAAMATPREALPLSVPSAAGLTRTARHRKTDQPEAAEFEPAKLEQTTHGNKPAAITESFPAPPMPLTEQEKLLLRVAHRRDSANLAMLNPASQATLIASEQAQFEKFFSPPPAPPTQPEVKDEGQSR
jgi:hypothetical protein